MIEMVIYGLAAVLTLVFGVLEFSAIQGLIPRATSEWSKVAVGFVLLGGLMFLMSMPDLVLGLKALALSLFMTGVVVAIYMVITRLRSGRSVREVWAELDRDAQSRREQRIAAKNGQ